MKTLWILMLAAGLALSGCSGEGKRGDQANRADSLAGNIAENTNPGTNVTPAPAPAGTPAGQNTPAQNTPPRTTTPSTANDRTERSTPPAPARSEPSSRLVSVEKGTAIVASFDEKVSTDSHKAGRAFTASLTEPLVQNGLTIFPAGTRIRGDVSHSKQAQRVGGQAELTLEFHELTTPDGKSINLHAEPLILVGESTASGDAQKVLGGAVGGAIVGGILGGKEGAVKGGAAGAGAGAAWAVGTRGNDIVLDAGSKVNVTLSRSINVPVTVPAGQNIP